MKTMNQQVKNLICEIGKEIADLTDSDKTVLLNEFLADPFFKEELGEAVGNSGEFAGNFLKVLNGELAYTKYIVIDLCDYYLAYSVVEAEFDRAMILSEEAAQDAGLPDRV